MMHTVSSGSHDENMVVQTMQEHSFETATTDASSGTSMVDKSFNPLNMFKVGLTKPLYSFK